MRRFERGLRHMNIHMPVEDAKAFFDSLDASGNGYARRGRHDSCTLAQPPSQAVLAR